MRMFWGRCWGQMASWMDISASKAVHRFLKGTNADAAFLNRAIDAIEFKQPVHVGDWVNFEAKIISTAILNNHSN